GTGVEDLVLAAPDTGRVPDSGPTVASRTCMIVGGCLARAARELGARIEQLAGTEGPFRERVQRMLARGGAREIATVYEPPAGLAWDDASYRGDAYPVYGWAADVAEVEVDVDTFEVEIVRLVTAVDVGRAIQPRLVE